MTAGSRRDNVEAGQVARWPDHFLVQSMKISGYSTVNATAESIWPLIFDPRTLLGLLPGCEQIEQVADNEYRSRLTLRMPAIVGTYQAHVRVLEREAPRFFLIEGNANGPAGSLRGQASLFLIPEGQGTRIEYQGDVQISGPLASMNPRFAEGVAETLIRQGLTKLPQLARDRLASPKRPAAELAGAALPPQSARWLKAWITVRPARLLGWLRQMAKRLRSRRRT